jgi:hypothetical protein
MPARVKLGKLYRLYGQKLAKSEILFSSVNRDPPFRVHTIRRESFFRTYTYGAGACQPAGPILIVALFFPGRFVHVLDGGRYCARGGRAVPQTRSANGPGMYAWGSGNDQVKSRGDGEIPSSLRDSCIYRPHFPALKCRAVFARSLRDLQDARPSGRFHIDRVGPALSLPKGPPTGVLSHGVFRARGNFKFQIANFKFDGWRRRTRPCQRRACSPLAVKLKI